MQLIHSTIIILVDKPVVVSKSREIKFARPLTEVIYERLEKGTDNLGSCRAGSETFIVRMSKRTLIVIGLTIPRPVDYCL